MESFGLMDASGLGFYLLLPLYLCLHPLTVEMSVCAFSIACKLGDWGYDQCKCTIWHSELEVQRARGNRGEERNHLLYITSCRISAVRGEVLGKLASCTVNKYICVKIEYVTAAAVLFVCFVPRSLYWNVFCLDFTSSAGAVTFKIHPSGLTVTWLPLPLWAGSHSCDRTTCLLRVCVRERACACVCNEELRCGEVIQDIVSSQ